MIVNQLRLKSHLAANVSGNFITDQLNIEKLKIYNSHSGDIDGICRNNRSTEKAIFGDSLDSTRTLISLKIKDIERISKRVTSYDYTKSTLTELYEKLDAETYKLFVDKILLYNDFQKVKHILETADSSNKCNLSVVINCL